MLFMFFFFFVTPYLACKKKKKKTGQWLELPHFNPMGFVLKFKSSNPLASAYIYEAFIRLAGNVELGHKRD